MSAPNPADLIPHAGAMVLLETVERADATSVTCLTTTHRAPDNPLRHGGILAAVCGAEYGAQAVAVHGALNGRAAGGYIAALKDLRTHVARLDDIPGPLRVSATRRLADDHAMIYTFSLSAECDGAEHLLVEGQVTIFLSGDTP